MMDEKKIEKAVELLQEAGLTACILLTMDEKRHVIHVKGSRETLVNLMMNALDDVTMHKIVVTSFMFRSMIKHNEEGGEK